MNADERAIRDLVETWMSATIAGDIEIVLDLMSDDVLFTVVDQEPFGKKEFAAAAEELKGMEMEGSSEIKELQLLGDWAFIRNYIEMKVMPPGADEPVRRSGYTLTLLRKEADGRWRLARDANFVS